MPAARNFKLGLFVIAAIVALVTSAVVLGIRAFAPTTVDYNTYFDESVQGLEVGAPVKYRGVHIGTVAKIDLARGHKLVHVVLALVEDEANQLQLTPAGPQLRAQLGGQGLTGLKFVDIDFIDPRDYPPPELPFPAPPNYIPARPSFLNDIAAQLQDAKRRVPALVDRATVSLDKLDAILDDVHRTRVVERAATTFDRLGELAVDGRRFVRNVDSAHLPAHVAATLDGVNRTLAGADKAIAQTTDVVRRVDGHVGALGRATTASAEELGRTMRELGDAAMAVRDLAEELERDPEVLVKGRARSSKP